MLGVKAAYLSSERSTISYTAIRRFKFTGPDTL